MRVIALTLGLGLVSHGGSAVADVEMQAYKVEITAPEECMGDIMGDINSRRGRVLGMESTGKIQVIKAQVPMSETLKYAADLRSMTGGRGGYSMEFSHYEEVPAFIAEKVIKEAKAEKEKAEKH